MSYKHSFFTLKGMTQIDGFFFFFIWPKHQHMIVRILGSHQLQLPANDTATATPDLSCVCDLLPQLTATPDP